MSQLNGKMSPAEICRHKEWDPVRELLHLASPNCSYATRISQILSFRINISNTKSFLDNGRFITGHMFRFLRKWSPLWRGLVWLKFFRSCGSLLPSQRQQQQQEQQRESERKEARGVRGWLACLPRITGQSACAMELASVQGEKKNWRQKRVRSSSSRRSSNSSCNIEKGLLQVVWPGPSSPAKSFVFVRVSFGPASLLKLSPHFFSTSSFNSVSAFSFLSSQSSLKIRVLLSLDLTQKKGVFNVYKWVCAFQARVRLWKRK